MNTQTIDAYREEISGRDIETCVLCGKSLNNYHERRDGICYGCDPDAPMSLLPTDTGRAVLAYTRANRSFWDTLTSSDNCDEEGVPVWDSPAVEKARDIRQKVANVLSALDFTVCNDCTLLDCVCP